MRGGVGGDMSSTCAQGGHPRPLGGYQPNLIMEPHSPAPAWQLHHPVLPKQEPMEEDRNDSGITSGSDFHSSSPGSENSQDYNPANRENPTYYSTPLMPRIPISSAMAYHANIPLHLGPQSAPSSFQVPQQGANSNATKDETSASTSENSENEDPLRRLESAVERARFAAPTSSPRTSEHSADDDNKSDTSGEDFDEQEFNTPRMNSHGKIKTMKCKQCDFVTITKTDFWSHMRGHIPPEKLLTCPKCTFVTEYKHHLEYHLRNHFGSKPFKCSKCSYQCVNKSMLNSHMKSHSNIYQYRCADCGYATKYCHSLKLHLRKYNHSPAMVLDPDGTPNPLPIIDVYGTRRGPKQRPSQKLKEPDSALYSQFASFVLNGSPPMLPYSLLAAFPNHLSMSNPFSCNLENMGNQRGGSPLQEIERQPEQAPPPATEQPTPGVLDLSKPVPSPEERPQKNRRKGRAFKLDSLRFRSEARPSTSSDGDGEMESIELPKNSEEEEKPESAKSSPVHEMEGMVNDNNNHSTCQYCNISFGDIVLYTMHMGYHGFKDPFTCNMCGDQCKDKISFFLHIARNPHV